MCQVFTSAGLKGYFWKTEKVNYISLFVQLQVLLSSFSAPTAPVLILVKIFAQIRESVFNFSKAVVVVNQSRREVCQPGFLAIIGPKLADGPPILQEKYKMPQIQIRRQRHKFAFLQKWTQNVILILLQKKIQNTNTNENTDSMKSFTFALTVRFSWKWEEDKSRTSCGKVWLLVRARTAPIDGCRHLIAHCTTSHSTSYCTTSPLHY